MTLPEGRPDDIIDTPPPWDLLHLYEAEAARFPLNILVWGPAKDDSIDFRKRQEIRDTLRGDGHYADFSEDLVQPGVDPVTHEVLQARSAGLIFVLYGSRGVQTEVDRILIADQLATKAVIFIHEDQYKVVQTSLSGVAWADLARQARRLITYSTADLEACLVVSQAREIAQQLRFGAFVDYQKRSGHG